MKPSVILYFFLVIELGCRIFLLTRLNVHWDEFHFLSQIYSFQRGDLVPWLQTFHVRLLSWLTAVPGREIEQIILGRTFMFCLDMLSLWFLFFVLRRRFSFDAAMFGLVAYGALFETSLHGASFRSDPMLFFLFTGALLLLPHRRSAVGSAALFALGLALNLKAALLLGWFWLFALLFDKMPLRWWSAHLASLLVFTAALFAAHRAGLPAPDAAQGASRLAALFGGFLLGGVSPAGVGSLLSSLELNTLVWAFALCGVYSAWRTKSGRTLAVLCLAGPAMCLLYRNSWPYFMPLALGLFALPLAQFYDSLRRPWVRLVVATVPIVMFLFHFSTLVDHGLEVQDEILDVVHELFPKPVPYLDRGGMVASFPSVAPLLSSWVLERAQLEHRPIITRELLERTRPRFLILNSPALDDPILREYFAPLWGPVQIARDYSELNRVTEVSARNPLVPKPPIYRY